MFSRLKTNFPCFSENLLFLRPPPFFRFKLNLTTRPETPHYFLFVGIKYLSWPGNVSPVHQEHFLFSFIYWFIYFFIYSPDEMVLVAAAFHSWELVAAAGSDGNSQSCCRFFKDKCVCKTALSFEVNGETQSRNWCSLKEILNY